MFIPRIPECFAVRNNNCHSFRVIAFDYRDYRAPQLDLANVLSDKCTC